MNWTVSYSIVALATMKTVSSSTLYVRAETREDAVTIATDWVFDHDPCCDHRLDPYVRINDVAECDNDPEFPDDCNVVELS